MAMSMITCSGCGARHHYRSKCSCQSHSGSGGGSGLGKVGFILCWVALLLAFAVVVSLVIWWAGEEFGRIRGTIAAAGIMLLLNLFVLGMLTEAWLDGEGDWDPFNHMLGNIMGGLANIRTFGTFSPSSCILVGVLCQCRGCLAMLSVLMR